MIDAINSVVMRAYLGMKREEGQTFVEYSLIGVLVAVALGGNPPHLRGQDRRRARQHRRLALSDNSTGGGR